VTNILKYLKLLNLFFTQRLLVSENIVYRIAYSKNQTNKAVNGIL